MVDDGSSNTGAARLRLMGAVILGRRKIKAKGPVCRRGMQYALARGAQAVITLDADGQHRPEDIPKLLDAYQRWPDRLIIAARLERREAAPPLRRFANGFANFSVSWAAGCPIADPNPVFGCIRRPSCTKRPGQERAGAALCLKAPCCCKRAGNAATR